MSTRATAISRKTTMLWEWQKMQEISRGGHTRSVHANFGQISKCSIFHFQHLEVLLVMR